LAVTTKTTYHRRAKRLGNDHRLAQAPDAAPILKLPEPTESEIRIKGKRVDALSRREMRPYRRELQMVFQDPYFSLNPRQNPRHHWQAAGQLRRPRRGLSRRCGQNSRFSRRTGN
jgi:hypothetical protein